VLIEWCWEGYVTKYLFSKDHKTSWSAGAIKGRSSSVVRKPVSEWHHQGGSRGSRIAFFPFIRQDNATGEKLWACSLFRLMGYKGKRSNGTPPGSATRDAKQLAPWEIEGFRARGRLQG
jgi:hypothetical protein